jgi:hypothetical protein
MSLAEAEGAHAPVELETLATVEEAAAAEVAPETPSPDQRGAELATSTEPPLSAAALALRERLTAHGLELADEAQLSEVPGNVLALLLEAVPAQPGPRQSEAELRAELADRVATAHRLPRGVRERLATMLESVRFDPSGREEPALRVSDAVALLEEALPDSVLLAAGAMSTASHPRGEAFFSGDAGSLSDADARRLAAEQLARTGYR